MKRELLFLFGCMGTRLFLTWLAYKHHEVLKPLGVLALMISIGFMYIYLTGSRKTGIEVDGELIWWNDLRPIHSILYGTFAFMALNENPHAWKVLLLDTSIGFTAWSVHKLKKSVA